MGDAQMNTAQRSGAGWFFGRLRAALAVTALVATLAALGSATVRADCPPPREPRIPASEAPALNIDKHKKQLLAYQAGNYRDDIATVIADARAYVERRADQVILPTVVLYRRDLADQLGKYPGQQFWVHQRRSVLATAEYGLRLRRMDSHGGGAGDRADANLFQRDASSEYLSVLHYRPSQQPA